MATGLQIKVGADTTEFRQEIRELPREFEKAEEEISQSAERVGGAIDGALKGLISAGTVVALERVINHFDKVADAASKYGQTAEDIQRVGSVAESTGSNVDTVAMAMERAGIAAAKAARGNEEFVEKFDRAGIDAAAFSTATLTERIEMIAAAQNAAGETGGRHAAILEALGDSAAGIDFQRIADEMDNVSVASNETVDQLSRANDLMNKSKSTAMVFAAEGLGAVADYFERIGNILSQGDGGVLSKIKNFNQIALQLTPFAGAANMLGFGGKTIKELEDAEKRLNAIALLRSREGVENATEEQIKAEMRAIEEREKAATKATAATSQEVEKGNQKSEDNKAIKQRLLEISLQLKEAEAAGNVELANHLRYNEDIYKGILKYKEAEDAYAMAVREANAELAKRNKLMGGDAPAYKGSLQDFNYEAMNPFQKRQMDALAAGASYENAQGYAAQAGDRRFAGAFERMALEQAAPEAARSAQASEQGESTSQRDSAQKVDPATETTLQKVANFLEQLNTKLPQPVLV